MRRFSGIEYIKIHAANVFGQGNDRMNWDDRLEWFNDNKKQFTKLSYQASNKFLFIKAINAYKDALRGTPTGFIMSLDCTASGLQIMSCLSGCESTAKETNLINTGRRQDAYDSLCVAMNSLLEELDYVTRAIMKLPGMTHYYNKKYHGELNGNQANAFSEARRGLFKGPEEVKDLINSCWNCNALFHKWTLPDNHVAMVKVTDTVDTRIEIDELDHKTFTYRHDVNMPNEISTSLVANVIQGIDGYIVREMVRIADKQKFQLAHIYDSFWASPNHMNKVRSNYTEIMAKIAESNMLQDIVREITGNYSITIEKDSQRLGDLIRLSEYALS